MKKLLTIVSCVAIAACNNATTDNPTNASTVSKPAQINLPYPVMYSSNFEMGDPAKAQVIAELWKDFDNNTLSNHKDAFADSINMQFSGMEMNGLRDTIIAQTENYRSQLASVKSSIDAVFTAKAVDKDKDGNWVCIWGSEVVTDKAGKIDSSRMQEIWHFNKNGKIDYMSQYRQGYPTAKK